jgi:ribosome biogenesis SPOUT family RNA methylase Rps3
MKKIMVIEHLDSELYDWSLIEYKNISSFIGKDNVWFTNIKSEKDKEKLEKLGKVFDKSIIDINPKNACILDAESEVELNPENQKEFECFIFGGILGDYPPRKRTQEALTNNMNVKSFNIGKIQMSTDNAIYTVKQIISGKKMSELKFQDNVEIKINDILTTQLPYRYNIVENKPFISSELIDLIIKRDSEI